MYLTLFNTVGSNTVSQKYVKYVMEKKNWNREAKLLVGLLK